MGIIILLSVLLVVLITLTVIGWNYWNWDCSLISAFTIALICALGIALIVCIIDCICTQVSEDTCIYELKQDREALVESYNTYYNNYDKDLAHSQSLKEIRQEIADFNANINTNNSFCNNFWLNWFFIDCEGVEPIVIENGVAK